MSTPAYKDNERCSRERSSAECQPLLAAATRDLFRKNAFRITGLSVDANAREVAKHADKIKMLAEIGQDTHTQNAAFPMKPPPSLDEIREALQKLKDPEKRLIDEFFWFWPQEFGGGQSDPAMQALARGDSKTAVAIWVVKENDATSGVIAKHNLALVYHVCALDWDNHSVKNEVEVERRQKISDYWKGAFNRWERLATDEAFWEKVTARIRQLNEPNLPTGFARRMRATLPEALDKINAELALAFAESGKIELARLHIRFMRETHPGLDDVEKTAELVLTPARNRLKDQIQRAKESAQKNPANAHEAARILIDHAHPVLELFDLFFGEQEHFQKELFDDVATTAQTCLVTYQRKTGDNETFVKLLEKVLPLAESVELRLQIEKNIGIGKVNLSRKERDSVFTLLKFIEDIKESPSVRLSRFERDAIPALVKAAGITGYSVNHGYLSAASADCEPLFETAARVLREISLDAWNNHQDRRTALAANELALKHVSSVTLKQRLTEDRDKLQQNSVRTEDGIPRHHSGTRTATNAPTQLPLSNKYRQAALVVVGVMIILGIIGSCNSTTDSSSSNTYTPPPLDKATFRSNDIFDQLTMDQPQVTPHPTTSSSRPAYRVTQNASTELDGEKQSIESEKNKADRLDSQLAKAKQAVETQKAVADELGNQLETLGRQIERERIYLDQTSQTDLDDFNRKVNRYNAELKNVRAENELANQLVDSYNALLEQLRAQNRKVNQMVDAYNAKLSRDGR